MLPKPAPPIILSAAASIRIPTPVLAITALRVILRPMKFRVTMLPVEPDPSIIIPVPLPEMRFPSRRIVPPMVFDGESLMRIPTSLGAALLPPLSTPIKLPWIIEPPAELARVMPSPKNYGCSENRRKDFHLRYSGHQRLRLLRCHSIE